MLPEAHLSVTTLTASLGVLAAMITPALLLSACGTFILSTSNRLARVVDRIRSVSLHIEMLSRDDGLPLRDERIEHERSEIKLQARRLRLLQWALTFLYLSAVTFVCTSVSIGLTGVLFATLYWLPVSLGICGAMFLLTASILLLIEARKAVRDLYEETEFHRRVTRAYIQPKAAPPSA